MIKNIIFLGVVLLFISGCSDDENAAPENKLSGDHVWKEQTQTIDRAKEVEGMLQDATEQQRKLIDEQTQ